MRGVIVCFVISLQSICLCRDGSVWMGACGPEHADGSVQMGALGLGMVTMIFLDSFFHIGMERL